MRSLNNIPRNMPDDLMKKLAAKGGVIGFQIGNEFHNRKVFDWNTQHAGKPFWDTTDIGQKEAKMTIEELDALAAPQFPMVGFQPPAPEEMKLTPEDWIADFDGGPTLPRGMRDVRDLPLITDAMVKRGWPEPRIRKFLGGNLLRVVRQVTETPRTNTGK
jgi:membrane dipeptidase